MTINKDSQSDSRIMSDLSSYNNFVPGKTLSYWLFIQEEYMLDIIN